MNTHPLKIWESPNGLVFAPFPEQPTLKQTDGGDWLWYAWSSPGMTAEEFSQSDYIRQVIPYKVGDRVFLEELLTAEKVNVKLSQFWEIFTVRWLQMRDVAIDLILWGYPSLKTSPIPWNEFWWDVERIQGIKYVPGHWIIALEITHVQL